MPKTYGELPTEGKKWIDDKQDKWHDKAKRGEWKKGVDAAIDAGRNPGAGIAAKLGLTTADMATSVTSGWEDIMGKKTEADHEAGLDAAKKLNKWRDKYVFKVTK